MIDTLNSLLDVVGDHRTPTLVAVGVVALGCAVASVRSRTEGGRWGWLLVATLLGLGAGTVAGDALWSAVGLG